MLLKNITLVDICECEHVINSLRLETSIDLLWLWIIRLNDVPNI